VWVSATAVSSCGVLDCRGNKHILRLHRSSWVSVNLSTCDWILCTGCNMLLDTVHWLQHVIGYSALVVKWIEFYYIFSRNAKYILRIFDTSSTLSCSHIYIYYKFFGQIQSHSTKCTGNTASWIVFVRLLLIEFYKKSKYSGSWSKNIEM